MKIKIEDIRKELELYKWQLISPSYHNLKSELTFKCEEGHIFNSTWGKLRNNIICPICTMNPLKKITLEITAKPKNTKRILAIDQASHISGWAIFDEHQLIKSGIFETTKDNEIERDVEIKNWLIGMIENWQPDYVGLEDIQLQNINGTMGVTTYKVLAHLQGILMETLYNLKIPYQLCIPAKWRSVVGVTGKTKNDIKKSMQLIVKKRYDITVTNDESDAIGIGIYLTTQTLQFKKKKPELVNWE